jgi:DNA repair ATPase RecN
MNFCGWILLPEVQLPVVLKVVVISLMVCYYSSLFALLLDPLPVVPIVVRKVSAVSAFYFQTNAVAKPRSTSRITCINRYLSSQPQQQLHFSETSPCEDLKYIPAHCDDTIDTSTVSGTRISPPHQHRKRSFIRTIRSHNLAGFLGESDTDTNTGGDVVISFIESSTRLQKGNGTGSKLIVITGETASGKSLFIVRALEILSGKITSTQKLTSYIPPTSVEWDLSRTKNHDTFVEVELVLDDPHLSAIEQILQQRNNWTSDYRSPLPLVHDCDDHPRRAERFLLRRTLQLIPATANDTHRQLRLKSTCTINGKAIPFKDFVMLTSPLFAVVDATTAINAILSKSITNGNDNSDVRRTSILDAAISKSKLWKLHQAQQHYKRCRLVRLKYEKQLQYQRTTQRFSNANGDDHANDLISHYIDELDSFAVRMTKFCQAFAIYSGEDDHLSSMPIVRIGNRLSQTKWHDNNTNESSLSSQNNAKSKQATAPYVSKMFELLLQFQNEFKTIENQYLVANEIAHTIGSLATSKSALSAIERTRKLLAAIVDDHQSTTGTDNSLPLIQKSTEHLHELLNQAEHSLHACVNFMENDNEMGLLPILNKVRSLYAHVSSEYISDIINEWKLLSRKHNISPFLLPLCHDTYISERDGTNQIQNTLLPHARYEEKIAYQQYWDAYQLVTNDREQVACELAQAMTEQYLPRLGFTASTEFTINIRRVNNTTDEYASSSFLVDKTDFLLSQRSINDDILNTSTINKGNLIHDVSSSGERARILFAIECALPGSIGIACRSSLPFNSDDSMETFNSEESTPKNNFKKISSGEKWFNYTSLPPIVTIYDEIDAHIGGRAVKAMAQLLVQQSQTSAQVMAITHNPTLAAVASTHVIIRKKFRYGTSENHQALLLSTDTVGKPRELTNDTSVLLLTAERDPYQTANDYEKRQKTQQQQFISVDVIQNDPYNDRRIQELVRMVCGSNDVDSFNSPQDASDQNVEAITFVKSLIRSLSN